MTTFLATNVWWLIWVLWAIRKCLPPCPSQKSQHFLLEAQIQNGHRQPSWKINFWPNPPRIMYKYNFSAKLTMENPNLTLFLWYNIILTFKSKMATNGHLEKFIFWLEHLESCITTLFLTNWPWEFRIQHYPGDSTSFSPQNPRWLPVVAILKN